MSAATHVHATLLGAVILTMLSCQVQAQTASATTEDGSEPDPGFLGIVASNYSQFAGRHDTRQTAWLPWIVLEGERFFLDTSSLQAGLTLWKTKTIEFELLVQPRNGFKSDGDPLLDGLDNRGSTAEAGLRTQWSRAGYTAQLGYYTGISNDTEGQAIDLAFSYFFIRDSWSLVPSLEWRREDRSLVNHQYGINAMQARTDRALYTGKATIITSAGLTAFYEKPGAWLVFSSLVYQRAGEGIRHSSIVGRDDGFIVSVGVGWTL